MADKRAGKSSTQLKPAATPQKKKTEELSEEDLKKVVGGASTYSRTGTF